MIVAGTGHRPDKLALSHHSGYSDFVAERLQLLATASLRRLGATQVISGMALGWDTALAEAALQLSLPLVAAVPFQGQELRWRDSQQARYRELLSLASEVTYVYEPGYAASKMQVRNEWMVNRCEILLALWNGSSGGTGNCVAYAERVGKKIFNVWGSWRKYALPAQSQVK